jgi:hypothetical protein
MKKGLGSLGLLGVALLMTACNGGMLDLPGSVASVDGTVQLRTSNGDTVTLNSASVGQSAQVSFYDNNGQGEFSMKVAGEVDPLIFTLAEKTSDLAPQVSAVNVHTTSPNMNATIDLTAGTSQNVDQEWDASGQCIFWQGTVQVCTRDDKGNPVCTQQLKTVYGTANFHYVTSGVIYHDELKITPQAGSVTYDLVNDQTSTSSTQTSPCVRD